MMSQRQNWKWTLCDRTAETSPTEFESAADLKTWHTNVDCTLQAADQQQWCQLFYYNFYGLSSFATLNSTNTLMYKGQKQDFIAKVYV